MDEVGCPRCKTTKYRNPSLKLMVNICGHTLCENCVDLLFVRGSGACTECNTPLRRKNFRLQLFEDVTVEKEVDIRKKILKDYNKKEEDFKTLREYNDYLEMVETLVFNLTSGIDVEQTKREIEEYRRENQEQIRKDRVKMGRDDEYLENLIEQEEHEQEMYRQLALDEQIQEKRQRSKNKEALIDELMFSDLPANHILASHKQEVTSQQEERVSAAREKATLFSTGIKLGKQEGFLPIPKKEDGPVFIYKALQYDYIGPDPPDSEELEDFGYLNHIRAVTEADMGGGYLSYIGCQRAVQEAFCGLYFCTESIAQFVSPYKERPLPQETDSVAMDAS